MSTGARSRIAALVCIAAFAAGQAARAATVGVLVTERGAGPVPNQPVALYAMTAGAEPRFRNPSGSCTTGPAGRCEIANLPVGVYVPSLGKIMDPNLCAPLGSPQDTYGTVTVLKPDAAATMRIELQRGARIEFRLVSENSPLPPGSGVEVSNDSGEYAAVKFDGAGAARITLGSGRWVAHLEGPQPARVTRVELDGAEVPTFDVNVELVAPYSDRWVTWTIGVPCKVRGKVRSNLLRPRVRVEASLRSPGPWGDSPQCRKQDCAGAPSAEVSPTMPHLGEYALQLPSGAWRLAPYGESLIESTPPFIDVTCGEGQDVPADFEVREKEGSSEPVLAVRVIGPDRMPLPNGPVEVWPERGNLEAAKPIAVESTGDWIPAYFSDLDAGNYLVRARRAGFRPGVEVVRALDPEKEDLRQVTIQLDKGATIDALAQDAGGKPVTEVGLFLQRTGATTNTGDPEANLAACDAERTVQPSKDQTGHVVADGLCAGTYNVTPLLTGAVADASVVVAVTANGTAKPPVTVTLGEHETREITLRVKPAPSFTGRLVCADGGLMPYRFDACLLGMPDDDETEAIREACRHPQISSWGAPLTGERRDNFRVGPLSETTYRLGLRPNGYSSWTWALGTPNGADAAVLQVVRVETVELGAIKVYCGPAVELRPTVTSGDPVPDLTLASVEAALTRTPKDGKVERRAAIAAKDRDRVALRELPEGEWTIEASISHPFFVPPVPVRVSVPISLSRGIKLPVGFAIASIGGAIAIEGTAAAARLTGVDGTVRIVAAQGGALVIAGVAEGSHRVESCEDAACARILSRWDAVQVVRGRKVVLTTASR